MPGKGTRAANVAAAPPEPPFYVALADLFVGTDDAGAMPVAAFRKGDQVHPGLVAANGWRDLVELPDGYTPPVEEKPDTEPDTEQDAADDAAGKE